MAILPPGAKVLGVSSPGKLPMKLRFPLSTLCLLVAVVALTIALFLLTARHNAQLKAMTAQFECAAC